MYFKRKVHSLVAFIMSALLCVTVLSACNQTEEVQSKDTTLTSSTTSDTTATQETTSQITKEETTTVSETTETTSTSKLEPVSEDIPKIVFVFSHNNDNTNIWGYYITNTGEVKMYDFRNIAPDEIYEIPDVYDRLEEATCTEVEFEYCYSSYVVNEEDLGSISKDELLEYYKKLLLVKSSSIKQEQTPIPEDIGHYRYYGVRYNEKGEKEFMLLMCRGSNYDADISDPYSEEIFIKMYSVFPNIL